MEVSIETSMAKYTLGIHTLSWAAIEIVIKHFLPFFYPLFMHGTTTVLAHPFAILVVGGCEAGQCAIAFAYVRYCIITANC